MYTITLNDNTVLANLALNGNNYISTDILSDAIFENNLSEVTISNGATTEVYTDMVLIQNKIYNGESWFILAEKSESQKELEAKEQEITDLQLAMVELYTMLGGV